MIMLASESQNLLPVLEMAEAVFRGPVSQSPPPGRDRLAQRAARLSARIRFALDEPDALRDIRVLTGDLHDAAGLDSLLLHVLDGALSLTEADFGTLHLRDPVTGSLWLVTQSGFGQEFLDYFAVVQHGDRESAPGRAAEGCAQAVIADVNTDAAFAPHRAIAAAAGFRAVQSTPLADYSGRLVGVVSTYFARQYLPAARQLRMMELYGDVAGEVVARRLGVAAGGDGDDPVGQALFTAMLDREDGGRTQHLASVPEPADDGHARDSHPAPWSALPEDVMSQFANNIVGQLSSVEVSLESARSIVGDGPAGEHIASATGEIDRVIHDIRTVIFSLAADAENYIPERWPPLPERRRGGTAELLDWVMNSMLGIGVALQAAAGQPPGTVGQDLLEAGRSIDEMAQVIRDHMDGERATSGLAGGPQLDGQEGTADHAGLQRRMARTARSLQLSAAGVAALLEQQSTLSSEPLRLDYATEIKRWRAFADQAEQIAGRWEQQAP